MNIADKLKILDLLDEGVLVAEVARRFKVNESTIRTIRNNKDNIRSSSAGLGKHAKFVKIVRKENIEKMEEMLVVWMQDLIERKIPLSTAHIRNQALKFHEYLNKKYSKEDIFNASKGWFENFKTRYSLHSLKFTGMKELQGIYIFIFIDK